MENRTSPEHDALDVLLDRSRMALAEPGDLDAAVEVMLADLADRPRGRVARLGRGRRVAAGIALSAVLAGAGMSAAAATGLWSWWAETPDLAYEFTSPSGEQCEVRYGLMSTSPTTAPIDSSNLDAGLAEWLAGTDVLAVADVDGALAAFEAGEVEFFAAHLDDDGGLTSEAVQPGEVLDADGLYAAAVEYAVSEVINDEVIARGLTGIAYGTESVCGEVMQ
ncbi:hypothetical protein EFN20_00300 [Propionibacterium freudenreichii]|uniref:Hypothetical membrane anchored protein n=2 Tax=Propionibacterium freudenreichii TaxID=1744 RepID=D7GHZ7_PROFC|nr:MULTISPECIES: hypothetical protein [Actinomycetes]PWM97703.1 MAG: hypothetical protein DBX96_07000 [Propionibacterium sp.]ARO12843.1 hypothetical protein BMR99_10535 [Propionibacterium freudenreichii]AWY96564.1 putative membrane anchored protein [Propionibacterium freudenreichii]AWY96615.1 putative membrane anchored protein [Propionibacterium freudenreichii]MCQ1997686.1 hypothetical protein [Propionibacterium freudenreichii]